MKHLILSTLFGVLLAAMSGAQAQELPTLDKTRTAVLVTDPQNDFLHPQGKLYALMEPSLKKLGTVEHIEALMKAAKKSSVLLAVDPLVYTALDGDWINAGALQRQLLDMQALHRSTVDDPSGFEGSGADYFGPFKPYIKDGSTLEVAPHKMYGPESNDLIYQLRSRGIDTVILAGLVANLCVDSHMRALMENGFRVFVVKDAVAAPGDDAYQAALTNYGMIANGVLSTREAIDLIGG